MNDLPRHTLSRIILEHGRAICDTPKRVEALLRDLCGAHRREINIIVGALEERVAADLLAARGAAAVPRDVLLARLAARLRDHLAYTPEAARWAVETWAVALGTMTEAELHERSRAESAESAETARKAAPPSPLPEAPPPATKSSPATRQAPPPPRGTTTHAPTRQPTPTQQPTPTRQPSPTPQASRPSQTPQAAQPSQTPQAGQPPSIVAQPAPAARRVPASHPPALRPPRQNVAPPPSPARDPSRRGLTLRGCFIGFVLLIVLIVAAVFVVPAVIMILKEEQAQPSINDPRIR